MNPAFVRKDLKHASLQNLKKHYLILFIICFIAAALGVEFSGTMEFLSAGTKAVSGKEKISSGAVIDLVPEPEGVDLVDLIYRVVTGGIDEAEIAAHIEESNEIANATEIFGRTNGIFASLANNFGSGKFYVGVMRALQNLTKSSTAAGVIFALIAVILYIFLIYIFLGVVPAIMSRFFLETRVYKKVPMTRAVFLLQLKKWFHVAWVLFVRRFYQFLWWFTIVGGFIKNYSYMMVPFIIAENPNLSAKEAITLSRQMMNGYKWKAFVLDLTMLGWILLGLLTLGLSDLFFFNMYSTGIYTELYVWLRARAKESGNELSAKLADPWLYEKAPYSDISAHYGDVEEELKKPVTKLELKGIKGFFARNFGFVLRYDAKEREYEQDLARMNSLAVRKDELEGISYPWRLNPYLPPVRVPKEKRFKFGFTIYYMRNYSLTSLILIFVFFSFFGWAWEVILHFVQAGNWVNRGVLHGPWLPIYGSGGVLMLLFLKRLRQKPILHFLGTIVLCGFVEYWTGYACEKFLGRRYWSYDGYFLNLDGRICAEGLLAFGIGGILMVYFLAPLVDDLIRKMPMKVTIPICVVLSLLFVGDSLYSRKYPNTNTGEDDHPKPTPTVAAMEDDGSGPSPEDLLSDPSVVKPTATGAAAG